MKKCKLKKIVVLLFLVFFFVSGTKSVVATELNLTEEEKNYIVNRKPISAASIDGVAPLHYRNATGEIVGIAVRTLDSISTLTGLTFDYELYESVEAAFYSESDIIFGISPIYTPENLTITDPYLYSKSILFMNSSLNSNDLKNEKYAAIKGGILPAGINKENALYYHTREEALDAVENGEAGYGYGNEYSIAYYIIRNSYENIISVPTIKETREYAIGLLQEDDILLSILNKAIQQIDEAQMNQLILEEAGNIEKKITFSMFLSEYGEIIFIIAFVVIAILLLITNSNIRARKELALKNKRHQLLSEISNECIFEYDVELNEIFFSEKCLSLFKSEDHLMEIYQPLKEIILSEEIEEDAAIINLKINNREIGVFKVIKSDIYGRNDKKCFTVGKLIDISEEAAEKERLITQSEIDDLTNLYNSRTTKKLINERLANRDVHLTDVLILIDGDNFKGINDTFGHLEGDQALRNISEVLTMNFRKKDIIGRIGGDEFCVYMKEAPSKEAVERKCEGLIPQIKGMDKKHNLTASIGIAFVEDETDYKKVFKNADIALYKAKDEGRAKVITFTDELLN